MGAKGKYETVSRVVAAFTKTRTWRQSELAAFVEIQPKQLGKILDGLGSEGMPLEREEDPPHVYWSVPPTWFPGGIHFSEADLPFLVHALLALPKSKKREVFLRTLLRGRAAAFGSEGKLLEATVGAIPMDDEEHEATLCAEEAISKERRLEGRYYSSASGDRSERVLSPYHLALSPRPRLVALCHRDRTLKWFRLDGFDRVRVTDEPRESIETSTLSAFLEASVDGFHDGSASELSFLVDAPDARWVRRNLPSGMRLDPNFPSSTSIRVLARGGLLVVARFVVGLGAAAHVESPELREEVRKLARAALTASEPPAGNTERGTSGS